MDLQMSVLVSCLVSWLADLMYCYLAWCIATISHFVHTMIVPAQWLLITSACATDRSHFSHIPVKHQCVSSVIMIILAVQQEIAVCCRLAIDFPPIYIDEIDLYYLFIFVRSVDEWAYELNCHPFKLNRFKCVHVCITMFWHVVYWDLILMSFVTATNLISPLGPLIKFKWIKSQLILNHIS